MQIGVLISTNDILVIQKALLHNDGYPFVLISWFTQDSLENRFLVVRGKNPIPMPYQCMVALRISILQYIKTRTHGSYAIDDGAFLADYHASVLQEVRKVVEGTTQDDPDEDPVMLSTEKKCIYLHDGLPRSILLKNNVTCSGCRASAVDPQNTDKAPGLTFSRCYQEGSLTVSSKSLSSLLHV